MSGAAQKWAIVTPTYHLDYEQFKLMCESMDRFVEGKWHHYVVVSKADYAMFAPFTGPCRTIIENTKILPPWLRYIAKLGRVRSGSFYFSWRTGLIFGWHIQQIVKLSMASFVTEDLLMLVDSDLFFIKPFKLDSLIKNGRLPFIKSPTSYRERKHLAPAFLELAKKTLGLPTSTPSYDYANNIVFWRRQTAIELCNFIARKHRKHWIAALSGFHAISEGSLYGLFVDYIKKDDQSYVLENCNLAKTLHGDYAIYDEELEAFVNNLEPYHIALGFQSSARFDNKVLRKQYEKFAR
jgi:Family of unknown function (DUF6492)